MESHALRLRLASFQIIPFLLSVAFLLVPSAAHAQEASHTPELKPNPMAALRAFEPPADQEYELGPGDEITVEVIGRPELASKHVIGPDGRITLSIAGSVLLADKTRDEAAMEIQTALGKYYSNVTVSVGVDHYTSNHILLLGAVEHPGLMAFDKTPTLLEVISRGGLPLQGPPGAPGTPATPANSARPFVVPEQCMIYRGDQTMVTVQLRSLLEDGNPLADMRLKRDDIVFVPGQDRYVSVLGQVLHPGNERLDSRSTLSQLLADAGGITEKAGRYPDIQIIHRGANGNPGKTQLVSYKALLDPKPLDLTLQSGDIIFVPQSGLDRAGYVFEKISPIVTLFTASALIAH